jgi:hypothetical protein
LEVPICSPERQTTNDERRIAFVVRRSSFVGFSP